MVGGAPGRAGGREDLRERRPLHAFLGEQAGGASHHPSSHIALRHAQPPKNYAVRVQALTPVGVLDRDKQLAAVRRLTDVVADAAGGPGLARRTWALLTESPDGGWGVGGHASTSAELAALAGRQPTPPMTRQLDPVASSSPLRRLTVVITPEEVLEGRAAVPPT